ARAVSSEVSRPRITSTSFSSGTGLKKCMPITCCGREVADASDVIGIDDVFDARIATGGSTSSARRKMSAFTAPSSITASIIRSAGTRSSAGSIRGSTSAGSAPPLPASFVSERSIACRPRSTAPGAASTSETRRPEAATTCAMPPPIWPAPTTRTWSNAIARQAIVAVMALVDVKGTRLWIETEGSGPAVLFLHGGRGASRRWTPVGRGLARQFRAIRYDYRHYGRSDSPGGAFATLDDLFAVLDAVEVDRTALVGLSMGGAIAIDAALAHPERVWAVAHIAGALTGLPLDLASEDEYAEYEAAVERGDLDAAMKFDFAMWAPLGTDEHLRELWLATPDA